jgi:hypothetical protein
MTHTCNKLVILGLELVKELYPVREVLWFGRQLCFAFHIRCASRTVGRQSAPPEETQIQRQPSFPSWAWMHPQLALWQHEERPVLAVGRSAEMIQRGEEQRTSLLCADMWAGERRRHWMVGLAQISTDSG